MPPLFSVIIPSYNRERYIARTLDSVLSQEFKDLEIIVVDDGSSDRTMDIVRGYGNQVCLIQQINSGPGAARNRGAAAATGKYIAMLDSDDLWFPWTLACYEQIIREADQPAFIAGSMLMFSDEAELSSVKREPLKYERYPDFYSSIGKGYYRDASAGLPVILRESFLQNGGYCGKKINSEDNDLALRLGTARGFIRVQNPWLTAYRRHGTGLTADITKTYDGTRYLISQEKSGAYPGEPAVSGIRRRAISQHARAASSGCVNAGRPDLGWDLYRATLPWNIRQRRMKYLLGFPLLAAARRMRQLAARHSA